MQSTKNGLKSILRTPGKTLLFAAILTVTAALLTISCCVYGAVRGYLSDCDDYFHTIAELEYLGKNYPEQAIYDEDCAEAVEHNRAAITELIDSDPVLAWEPASAELLVSPLIRRKDNSVPDPKAAVLRVRIHSCDELDRLYYTALVTECLYASFDQSDKLVFLLPPEDGTQLELGQVYLMTGRFYSSTTFQPGAFSLDGSEAFADLPTLIPDGAGAEAEAPFRRCAELLHLKNDSCRVSFTAAIEDLYPIHQQLMSLTKGRFFTQSEYESRARVCVVSEKLAGLLGLGLGDSFPCAVYRGDGDLYDSAGLTELDSGDYEIVGILSHSDNYPYWVFLPDAGAAGRALRPVNGYTIGQFRLKNDGVPAFLEAAAPLLEQGFRLNVYDQGYAAATEPMEELLLVSGIFLAVCLLLACCALVMQSHLFVSRQRETAQTMYALGSGRARVCVYFLAAALALTVPAAALGAFLGRQAEDWVFGVLRRYAAQFAEQDLRFSATRLAIVRTLDFSPHVSLRSYLLAAGLLAGGTLLFTLLFALHSLREKKETRKKAARTHAPKRTAKVSRLSGFFKYGLLSLRRGRGRTAAVLALGLAVALFFGQLTASLAGYRTQLDRYKAEAVISGNATDLYGKLITGLLLDPQPIYLLENSELVRDCCVSAKLGHALFLPADGEESELDPNMLRPIEYQALLDRVAKAPLWYGVSSVEHSPPFFYAHSGSVEWLEGWSEADFVRLEKNVYEYEYSYGPEDADESELIVRTERFSWWEGPPVCALPKSMTERYGICLGDRIKLLSSETIGNGEEWLYVTQLQVVAVYDSPLDSATIFSPITRLPAASEEGEFLPPDTAEQEDFDENEGFYANRAHWTMGEALDAERLGLNPYAHYSGFTFTLTDTARLDELRQTMSDAGFTWVHSGDRVKKPAMIGDEVYLNTVHSMERQIQYVRVLYGALYLLAGVIGFALAWLLLLSRRREIAVMRALGTQPGRILGNFFAEQLLLMTVGLALGIGTCRLTGTALDPTQLLLTAAFLAVWTLSTLISLLTGLRKRSFAALTEPE